jgi:EmrB/QacA subfamily drug resistance transporter
MTNLDLWVVNVALDAIGHDLPGATLSGLSWIINAYAVTLAALLIVAGRMSDRIGHRQVFLLGTIVFTLGSLACGLAPNLTILILARIGQAVGAAMLLPSSLGLLLSSVPPEQRMSSARLWSTVGAIAAAGGPVLGGLLIDYSWRWVFFINIPVGLAVLALGPRVLPRGVAQRNEPMPDLVGSVVLAIGIAALTGTIVQGGDWGWTSAATLGLLLLGALALVWFIYRCATQPAPLIELSVWRSRTFTVANIGNILFGISFAIMLVSNALWCQTIWGYSALRTGLAMAPGPAIVPLVAIVSNRALRRIGAGPIITLGSLLFAAGLLWRLAFAEPTPNYLVDMLPSNLLAGTGVGLAMTTLLATGSTALANRRAGTGAAVLNTGRQFASAIGVAILVAILGGALPGIDQIPEFERAWQVAILLAVGCAAVSLLLPRERTEAVAASPAPANEVATQAAHSS